MKENLCYMIMEYIPDAELYDIVEHYHGVRESAGRFIIRQLLDALEHMQEHSVVHRDLKLENILVNSKMDIKITDFG